MVHDVWCMVCGAWCVVHGVWCMMCGASCVHHQNLSCFLFFSLSLVGMLAGETTALQFFTLGKHITTKAPTLVLTDMPGYGFAFMKNAEAKRCFFLVIKLNCISYRGK